MEAYERWPMLVNSIALRDTRGMPIADLSNIEHRLGKRGFRPINVLPHICEKCSARAVAQYGIAGRVGGRDIELCQDCGFCRSWRTGRGGIDAEREIDPDFDLKTFLDLK
jgi:hypothetical protein